MKKTTLLAAVLSAAIFAPPVNPPAQAMDPQVLGKLAASRDALAAQLREIQRNYDDVSQQIDDLKKKQDLLDSYRRETEAAIREVERAMAQTR